VLIFLLGGSLLLDSGEEGLISGDESSDLLMLSQQGFELSLCPCGVDSKEEFEVASLILCVSMCCFMLPCTQGTTVLN